MGVSLADNSVKNWQNLRISNPKPDLHNINVHTKFGENPLMFTQVIIWKRKTDGLSDNQRETIIPRNYCVAGYKNLMIFTVYVFLIWVLLPFKEYFTYIEQIVHQRWVKTGEPGEKPPDHPSAELGFPTCDPRGAQATAVRNLMD